MFGLTYRAIGASSTVSLRINDAALLAPAIITSPFDQARFNNPDISVTGTCPENSYVKIYKNGVFNGVSSCVSNTFSFTITLSPDSNVLQVKVYNYSDQEGPMSGSITVYYDAPFVTPSPNEPAISTTFKKTDHLRIVADYSYKVYKNGQPIQLDLALAGGTSPYAVAVNWNDGTITPIARQDKSPFVASHTYSEKSRLYTYVIKVAASDLNGNSDYIQLMAIVDGSKLTTSSPAGGGSSASSSTFSSQDRLQTILKYMWPMYLVVVLMVLSFYLGEKEEKRILTRKKTTVSFR